MRLTYFWGLVYTDLTLDRIAGEPECPPKRRCNMLVQLFVALTQHTLKEKNLALFLILQLIAF